MTNEKIIKIEKSNRKNKKYVAHLISLSRNERKIHFGDNRYQQFEDLTPNPQYSHLDHNDSVRRLNYFKRHSNKTNKIDDVRHEYKKSNGLFNAKLLSHLFLW